MSGNRFLVSAEHASNLVPEELGSLGLDPLTLESHVAWDPGAREVATSVAEALDAPLFLGRHTRLVADLNRSPDNPEVVPGNAFGTVVPANLGLSEEERRQRIERYHAPHWSAVLHAARHELARDPSAVLLHLSVHSFTPVYDGHVRPMSIGLLFDPDRPLEREVAGLFLEALPRLGLSAAENEPYSGIADALVTACRKVFSPERYAGIELEINQRHLAELDRIARAFCEILASLPDLPSRIDRRLIA